MSGEPSVHGCRAPEESWPRAEVLCRAGETTAGTTPGSGSAAPGQGSSPPHGLSEAQPSAHPAGRVRNTSKKRAAFVDLGER